LNPDGGGYFQEYKTGLHYYQYGSARVNIRGPFLGTGKFGDYSGRAGRALAILHEIAHMIVVSHQKNRKGQTVPVILIPADDSDPEKQLCAANTAKIQKICKSELDQLAR
jgi:hypothetical protein